MTIDDILPVAPRHLLLANAVIWGAPGIKVLVTGIRSYLALWPSGNILWLALGTVATLIVVQPDVLLLCKEVYKQNPGLPEGGEEVASGLSSCERLDYGYFLHVPRDNAEARSRRPYGVLCLLLLRPWTGAYRRRCDLPGQLAERGGAVAIASLGEDCVQLGRHGVD